MSKTTKAIVLLCEGTTDVAFLRRLLIVADSYTDYKKAISEMRYPFKFDKEEKQNGYFINKIKAYKYDSAKLHERPLLPIILERNKANSYTLILLYSMGGKDQISSYNEIIEDFYRLAKGNPLEERTLNVSLGLIYDYDNASLSDRLTYIKEHFQSKINELQYLSETKKTTNSQYFKKVGYHILPESLASGTLEDIILPIIEKKYESLVSKAEEFLKDEGFERAKESDNTQVNENKTASDFKKSTLGVIGQIEHSGLGNSAIIQNSSLIDNDELKNSEDCKRILTFIKDLRNAL